MKTLSVPSGELAGSSRLDAYFHLSDGRRLSRQASGETTRHKCLGAIDGLGAFIWAPARFKRVYAVAGEEQVPYLRPSDTLNYVPRAADVLSATRSANINKYRLTKGMILVTCSGRNLGPAVYVDGYLERFVLSHDMIRIEIKEEALRFYVLAVLGTATGQLLLRKDKSGSVIDHITVGHVASLQVPMLPQQVIRDIALHMRRAVQLREDARQDLDRLKVAYEATLPALPLAHATLRQWSISSRELVGRLDAAPYASEVITVRKALKDAGGCLLGDVATALKPPGRYKTIYVDRENGVPILSGGQLLQIRPLNPRFMAARALKNIDRYRLRRSWIAYQADGRSEEALGEPVMITSNREGWLASGHVGRLVAHDAADAGGLYLAFQSPHAQLQLKALASGSVVDATFPQDAQAIVLPPLPENSAAAVEECWTRFSQAQAIEEEVYRLIESGLSAAWDSRGIQQ